VRAEDTAGSGGGGGPGAGEGGAAGDGSGQSGSLAGDQEHKEAPAAAI
jgi:hypothetical protein